MILPFAYTIIRSKRKSIQIRVNTQGQVEVRGGRRLTKAQAEQILYQHQDWIQTQIARQTARAAQRHILTADEIANLTEQAERDLPVRTAHWASRMGVQPTGVRITAAAFAILFASCCCPNPCAITSWCMNCPTSARKITARTFTPRGRAICPTSFCAERNCAHGSVRTRGGKA